MLVEGLVHDGPAKRENRIVPVTGGCGIQGATLYALARRQEQGGGRESAEYKRQNRLIALFSGALEMMGPD